MISQTLRDARKYEEMKEKQITKKDRPDFHLSTRVGWLNDPNGFSYYQGQYHLFYQYYPYDSHWGPMHWGHAVSKDMLHWTYLPAVLAPDMTYDRDGCFSGGGVVLPDGRHLLMYTGVSCESDGEGNRHDVQTQCIAVGDGYDYEKYEKNPVIDETMLPEGNSRNDFRDPKIWQESDGTYRCILANRAADGTGCLLLYRSKDALCWEFESTLLSNHDRYGKMWECPDFFELDGKHVVLISPQDMIPQGFEYHNGNGNMCFIGEFDEKTKTFKEETNQAIDYGIDFYATQTILTLDGRRVMMGWMQNWDTCNNHRAEEQQWFGQMSLPREIFIKNGRLYQKPIRELEELRQNKVVHDQVKFSDILTLEGIRGRKVDMEITLRPGDPETIYKKFAVRFAQDDNYYTSVSFRPYESILKIDRKFSGSRRAIIHQRRSQVKSKNGEIKLRMILDKFSAEIFVNDGEHVLTATLYTDQSADGISFFADGQVEMRVVKYDLVTSEE